MIPDLSRPNAERRKRFRDKPMAERYLVVALVSSRTRHGEKPLPKAVRLFQAWARSLFWAIVVSLERLAEKRNLLVVAVAFVLMGCATAPHGQAVERTWVRHEVTDKGESVIDSIFIWADGQWWECFHREAKK